MKRLGWLPLLALLACAAAAEDVGISLSGVNRILRDVHYLIDAQIDYRFSAAALEALDNGVPLTLDLHYRLRRRDAWIWEASLVDRHQRYQIRYLPLTRVYQVAVQPSGRKQSFVTRAAAISALGETGRLPLVPQAVLDPAENYVLRLKVSLDIEALPLPLRPVAYLKPSWKLSSGWTEWPFVP